MFIVQYAVSIRGNLRWFWIRPEGTPNTRHYATRFANSLVAEDAVVCLKPPIPGLREVKVFPADRLGPQTH